jgi:hypothetical protein
MAKTPRESARDITCEINANEGRITFRSGLGDHRSLTRDDFSVDIQNYAMFHGLKQKIVDKSAGCLTIKDKWEAITAMIEQISGIDGNWFKARTSDGEPSGNGLLVEALLRVYASKNRDQIKAFLADKTSAQQAGLRENAKIKTVIDQIKAERIKPETIRASDNLLAELEV